MQLKLISLVGLAWGLTGCNSPTPIPSVSNPQSSVVLSSPVRIYVAIDRTFSVGASKIPSLKLDNLQPLLELVKKVGGEVRVAEVCTSSDLRLNSFYMPEPPLAPQPPAPMPKPGTVNPLELPKLQKQSELQAKAYQQQLSTYDRVMALRQQEAQRNSKEFTTKISKVLEQPPSCKASDVVGMVERGDLYLAEAGNWRQLPRNIALLITDGLETARNNPKQVKFTSNPQVLLVSSGGQAGILQPLLGSNKPYESIEGAVRFITGK
ncbi:hypothetical protein [Chamaesiphon sp. GL140_3_metabinner_50]|uniref:hypothetical protein n=1 Tax=Chamaesiphon sp. GL140_3_metabinner_50 TaxID=2970812 RepID=UPI0025ED0C61|nr:hypothetical protein [Chamaesiphon sp. GL140_3_metabinner_50]